MSVTNMAVSERRVAGRLMLMSLSFVLFAAAPIVMRAQTSENSQQTAPDNSGANKTQDQGKTADQQPNDDSDIAITAKIRRMVVADKSLSIYGHNVKIIVRHGAVTLKGPVKSDDERQTITQMATGVVGQGKVTDHMTVKQ